MTISYKQDKSKLSTKNKHKNKKNTPTWEKSS